MPDQQTERDHLASQVVALFLLGDDAVTVFSQAIYDTRVQVLADAYAAPSDELLAQMATESKNNAMSIVTTYNADVTSVCGYLGRRA
jgi:hypothetical protein